MRAARGGPDGADYRFLDRTARPGHAYTFRLETVGLDGSRRILRVTRLRL